MPSDKAVYKVEIEPGVKRSYYERELSWLSFNHRVLQEAADVTNPLYERLKFLAIYSSNLDEFFKVRVASLRHMIHFSEKARSKLAYDPVKLHREVLKEVEHQQNEFLDVLHHQVIPELEQEGIHLVGPDQLSREQGQFVTDYFEHYVRPWTRPMLIIKKRIAAFLKNNTLYLLIRMIPKPDENEEESAKLRSQYASLEIPTDHCSRWLVLPEEDGQQYVMFLDDVIRYKLPELFPGYEILEAHAAKLTRDADFDIEDEYSGNIVNKIRKMTEKRRSGLPSRFVYDRNMSPKALQYFREAFLIPKEDLLPSDPYHNYEDFFDFPRFNKPHLENEKFVPLAVPGLDNSRNLLDQIAGKRLLLYFPYHDYDPVLAFLHHAARDPEVISIKITLYRVAKESRVIKALRKAAEKGKDVTVFTEVKARFDEMSNILAAEKLESSGVNVLYSLPGLKVHCKLCIIARKEDDQIKRYAYLSTGNFNENTAKLYGDFGYFTANQRVCLDIGKIFKSLVGIQVDDDYERLLVAPRQMREEFYKLINFEIEEAQAGKEAYMFLKMNSLEDQRIINKLYDASNAGVKIRLIVRGICCLVPGVKNQSENIEVISIVDRFLEHARAYIFGHGGRDLTYLASSDWMSRNLSRRIETAFPIDDKHLKEVVRRIMEIQWSDNVKARIVDQKQANHFVERSGPAVQSQLAIYDYLKEVETMVDMAKPSTASQE